MSLITAPQLRAARALLGITQAELAERSGVSLPTIKRLETESGPLFIRRATREALEKALVEAGIDFIEDSGLYHSGVRLIRDQYHTARLPPSFLNAITAACSAFPDEPFDVVLFSMRDFAENATINGSNDPWADLEKSIENGSFKLNKGALTKTNRKEAP